MLYCLCGFCFFCSTSSINVIITVYSCVAIVKVKQHKPAPLYLTDEAHGHTVLKLPVAHCEFNPIELAWVSVKGYVDKYNKTHCNLPEIERLTSDRFTITMTDMWRNFCKYVVDIENDYFEKKTDLMRTQ